MSDENKKVREVWLDYLRAFACVLVALGHLLMSMQEANIIKECHVLSFFIEMIYYFHVYIFFFCSGYLYQKNYTKCDEKICIWKKKLVHCIDLVIPYVVFSAMTYFIKTVLPGDVNSMVDTSFIKVLLEEPINQMWYLYALILIILVTPAVKKNSMIYSLLAIGIVAKIIISFPAVEGISSIKYLCSNAIWFILGMFWQYKKIRIKKYLAILCSIIFVFLCLYEDMFNIANIWLNHILTLFGLLATVGIIYCLTDKKSNMSFVWRMLSKYMFQIYLLHTICAASIRIVLLKVGCMNFIVHFVMGTIFSFVVPVICAMIAEKMWVLNIVFFPSKTFFTIRKKAKN